MWRVAGLAAIGRTVPALANGYNVTLSWPAEGEMRQNGNRRGKAAATGRKRVAWLALFSLFLQLWITAGHFHPEDFAAFSGAMQAGGGVTASADPRSEPAGALLHNDCALCLSVQTAGNAALAKAASPGEPAILGVVALGNVAALPRTLPAHFLFQTRAPPIA